MGTIAKLLDNIIKDTQNKTIKWKSEHMFRFIAEYNEILLSLYDSTYDSEQAEPNLLLVMTDKNIKSHNITIRVPQYTDEYDKLKILFVAALEQTIEEDIEKFSYAIANKGCLHEKYHEPKEEEQN